MGGEINDPDGGGVHPGTTAAAAPLGEAGFVVVENQEIAGDDYDVVPDADLNEPDSVNAQDETGRAASRTPSVPFMPEAFQAIGSSLSASARSSRRSSSSSSSASSTAPTASIVQPDSNDDDDGDNELDPAGDPAPPFDISAAFLAAWEVIYEFFYAYAIVVYHEAMALVEKAYALAGSARRAWDERDTRAGPWGLALPPSVKRAVRHKLFPLVFVLVLSLLVILPAYYLVPGDEPPRLSARQWQARYEELSSKHSAAIVRSRLKYDHLAGRHVELQAEYEAVLEDLKKQAPPEVAGACSEPGAAIGPMSMAKDALLVVEQTAYDMFRHFSEGLREDAHEVKGVFQRKTRSLLDALR